MKTTRTTRTTKCMAARQQLLDESLAEGQRLAALQEVNETAHREANEDNDDNEDNEDNVGQDVLISSALLPSRNWTPPLELDSPVISFSSSCIAADLPVQTCQCRLARADLQPALACCKCRLQVSLCHNAAAANSSSGRGGKNLRCPRAGTFSGVVSKMCC